MTSRLNTNEIVALLRSMLHTLPTRDRRRAARWINQRFDRLAAMAPGRRLARLLEILAPTTPSRTDALSRVEAKRTPPTLNTAFPLLAGYDADLVTANMAHAG